MIAINRIWVELKQSKENIICLQRYTDKGRARLRIYDSFIILCSAGGALGGAFNALIAIIGVGLIAIGSILKAILSNLIQSEQEFIELDRLMDFYCRYMNSLEQLWYKYYIGDMKDDDMMKQLFEMKENEADKYSILNKGIRSLSKKEREKINKESERYIDEVYFKKIKENEQANQTTEAS